MADKPRYRGIIKNGRIELEPVSERYRVEGSGGDNRPRYRAVFLGGELKVGQVGNPQRLETVEAELLRNIGDQERGGPVEITYFPTATSNPGDPRTAAAGYDRITQTLRVEWGDGGPAYNYYNVPPNVWRNFQRVKSPGRLINRVLNGYEYGPA